MATTLDSPGHSSTSHASSSNRLVEAICSRLQTNSPIICHLNADTSWLLLLPYPPDARPGDGRRFFKLLIDPWFAGPQVDYFVWFSIQRHAIPASVETVAELERILVQVDRHERVDKLGEAEAEVGGRLDAQGADHGRRQTRIDAVIVSHEFTDHCHKATLTQLHPSTPIIAGGAAAKLIRSWGHFDSDKIRPIPTFLSCISPASGAPRKRLSFHSYWSKSDAQSSLDWRLAGPEHMPSWISVSQLHTPRDVPQKGFHAGVLIAFHAASSSISESSEANAILYSPHGLTAAAISPLIDGRAKPAIRPLALLHGVVKIMLAGGLMPLNLGGRDGLQVATALGVPYWIGTHEEDKLAGGGVSFLLKRRPIPVPTRSGTDNGLQATFRELASGEVMVLQEPMAVQSCAKHSSRCGRVIHA